VGKKLKFLLFLILISSSTVFGQAIPAAEGNSVPIYIGGQVSSFNPDWGCASDSPVSCWGNHFLGLGVYIDANHLYRNFGAEGETRWLHWLGPAGQRQSNYLLGPRYKFLGRGRFAMYGKVLLGGGWITLPDNFGHGSYFDIAPGVTAEYRIRRRVTLRGDFEYQEWPSFSGIPAAGNNGLTPSGFSVGAAYRLW
jgi:hypothetical protein